MIDYTQGFLDLLVPILRPYMLMADLDYPLLQAFPNAKSQIKAFALITYDSHRNIGTIEHGLVGERGRELKQQQSVTISISTFGKGAKNAANKLNLGMEFPSMTQKLGAVGITHTTSTEVRDLTGLIETAYEERASFSMVLGTSDGNIGKEYDPSKEGLPNQPLYDPGSTPAEHLEVTVALDEYDAGTITI